MDDKRLSSPGKSCNLELDEIMISQKYIQETIRPLIHKYSPQRIILFVSQARGTADDRSDVDLLVIARFQGQRRTVLVEMDRTLLGIGFGFDLILLTPEEYERDRNIPGTVARPASIEGKVLYESPE